jgi:tetratricopeptide (TPR) repeat protein
MSAHPARLADPYEEGLTLSRQGRHAEAIARFESALASNPDDARVLFALGNTARALGMAAPAEQFFHQVLALEPERLEALVNLANLLRTRGAYDAAEALLKPALARDPGAPELWLTLGSVYREMGDDARAAAHYREALARRPDYVAALCNLADLSVNAGAYEDAFTLYARALSRDPKNARARFNRSVLHFLKGDLREGWRDYEARLKIATKHPAPDHGLPRWDGASLNHKRLLVSAEQGIGDQIMFASVIPDLVARAKADGGAIVVECEPRLVALFARSFPDAAVHASKIEMRGGALRARYDWLKAAGGANAFIELGSLPKILRRALGEFPDPNSFLIPDAEEAARWRTILPNASARTGICWRSGMSGGSRSLQYAPLDAWAAFIRELPGAIVCAQYDANPEEIAALQTASGRGIFVPPQLDQKNELDRTVAMLSVLDAVVSAPTAVSWLAAACGTPTIKVLYDSSWTGFGEDFEPFAPACKHAKPDTGGDWTKTFDRAIPMIKAALIRAPL